MKVLETEIDFDFYDAKQMKKLEANMDKIVKEINKIKVDKMKQSQFINKFCTIIENGFDNILERELLKKYSKKKGILNYVYKHLEI